MSQESKLTFPDLLKEMDKIKNGAINLEQHILASDSDIFGNTEMKQGYCMLVRNLAGGMTAELFTKYIKDNQSEILVTSLAPSNNIILGGKK